MYSKGNCKMLLVKSQNDHDFIEEIRRSMLLKRRICHCGVGVMFIIAAFAIAVHSFYQAKIVIHYSDTINTTVVHQDIIYSEFVKIFKLGFVDGLFVAAIIFSGYSLIVIALAKRKDKLLVKYYDQLNPPLASVPPISDASNSTAHP